MKYGAAFLMLFLAACSGGADDNAAAPEALVKLQKAEVARLSEMVMLYGQAEDNAAGKAALFAPVEARLLSIEAPVGSLVKAGDVILRLAPGPAAALEFAKAKGDAQAADAASGRAMRLRKAGLAGDAEVEAAKMAKGVADDTLASLEARFKNLTLRAPVDGYVETIGFRPGDLAPAGSAMASLTRGQAKLRLRFGVDPALIRQIDRNSSVKLWIPGSDRRLAVKISSLDPVVDPQTKLASLYASAPVDSGLAAGEAVKGQVSAGSVAEAVTVPYAALLEDGGQPYVYVVTAGVAHRHDVLTGVTDGRKIAVSKGVQAGDWVVVAGGTALEDGMKVRLK